MATITPHLLLRYRLAEDYLARRAAWRDEHLGLVREYRAGGWLRMAGALVDPVDKAVLVFGAGERKRVEEFVGRDPYVREGLVLGWEIREWAVVGSETEGQ